ncbi:MAG: copper chaperone CopZ [Patiriisocius sp.]|jgi:copper chaperone CopZ
MRRFIQLLFLSLFLYACQNVDKVPVTETDISGPAAKQTAAIVVEGMSCQMACVSSINKTLSAMNGANMVDIHFDADRTLDTCYIDFNEQILDTQMMVDAIQKCNGGVYTVKSVHVTNVQPTTGQSKSTSASNVKVNERDKVKYSKFNFPSLLDLVKSVGF